MRIEHSTIEKLTDLINDPNASYEQLFDAVRADPNFRTASDEQINTFLVRLLVELNK